MRLCSVGDISFSGDFAATHPQPDDWVSPEVQSLLCGEINLANLECVLSDMAPCLDPEKLCLAAEAAVSVRALRAARINLVSLANNHIMDRDVDGLRDTLDILERNRIRCFGAGMNVAEARAPMVVDIGGLKLAFFGRIHPPSFVDVSRILATETRAGVAALDVDELLEAAARIKQEGGADRVILYVHWGIQGVPYAQPEIHALASRLLRANVDIILGHHAHLIQGIRWSGDRFVSFGLGNFYFQPFYYAGRLLYGPSARRERQSLLVQIDMTADQLEPRVFFTRQNEADRLVLRRGLLVFSRLRLGWLGQRHRLLFHARWRAQELFGLLGGVSKGRLRKVLREPWATVRMVFALLLKPSHR